MCVCVCVCVWLCVCVCACVWLFLSVLSEKWVKDQIKRDSVGQINLISFDLTKKFVDKQEKIQNLFM